MLTHDLLPPGTLLGGGKYHLDDPLGCGGFGITYRATHLTLGRTVAIKEFFPREREYDYVRRDGVAVVPVPAFKDTYARGLARFIREGHLLAEITHPHVVQIFDLFEENGTAYLEMALVPGRSLRAELDAQPERRLPVDRVSTIITELVDALAALHARQIYHLDIKPENILLTPEGRAILIDFGAARRELARISRQNHPSTRAFTPEYAPAEVMAGEAVGPESDLFELGMLLHELLTGTLPPPAYLRLRPWTPEGLAEPWRSLVLQAVALHREDRPGDVRAWWVGTPHASSAHPTREWSPPRPRKTRRIIAWTAAALVLGLVAAVTAPMFGRAKPAPPPAAKPAPVATAIPAAVTHAARGTAGKTLTPAVPVASTPPATTPAVPKPATPPASAVETKPMPGEPRVTAPADPPAPERGAQPSAAEVQELAGFTNYKINTADRTIVALGIGKDRRAAELTAKRNLLHAVQTLPGHADATAGDLQGMQLDQEIKLADGGYGLIYLMPIPPAKE